LFILSLTIHRRKNGTNWGKNRIKEIVSDKVSGGSSIGEHEKQMALLQKTVWRPFYVPRNQGDQNGRIFAYWVVVYFGQFF
jgi:hypothetical protein